MDVWLNALKSDVIKSIFKDGDKHKLNNYRPISLTSNLAKIFEKIIYNRLYSFIKKNEIISENQFGFMKNIGTTSGTTDALGLITELILKKNR